jgi:hypothetical protein
MVPGFGGEKDNVPEVFSAMSPPVAEHIPLIGASQILWAEVSCPRLFDVTMG